MKLASVLYQGSPRLGQVYPETGMIGLFPADTGTMLGLIAAGTSRPAYPETMVPLSEVQVQAPIPQPQRNIMCVGKNYREHAKEFARSGYEAGAVAGKDVDDFPALFSKLPTTVIGQGDEIDLHAGITQLVDYEAELAVIIGTGGRGITRENAYAHVWGYTIINDVTARDLQRDHKQWFLGKSLDTFCPMGPWIVTADEVDPEAMQVTCHVNGDLRQDANTRDLIFDIPTLIATLSAGITLLPGDIIATGTPAGVGIGMKPPQFLGAGDTVSISITGIGTLTNQCRQG